MKHIKPFSYTDAVIAQVIQIIFQWWQGHVYLTHSMTADGLATGSDKASVTMLFDIIIQQYMLFARGKIDNFMVTLINWDY